MSCRRILLVAVSTVASAACGDNVKPGGEDRSGEIWVDAPLDATTSEAGAEVAVEVMLSVAPAATLSLTVTTDAPAEGVASVERVVFEAGEVGPRRFTVRGVDDRAADGEQPYQLVFGEPETTDARFARARARSVTLRNLDNDVPFGTVSVSRIHGGTGTVTSAPAGISCPATCSADFPDGTKVVLSAAPAEGSARGGWLLGTQVSFAPQLEVDVEVGQTYAVSAGFVRDEVEWMTAIDGTARERIDAIAAGNGKLFTGGHFEGPTMIAGRTLAHGGGSDPLIAAWSSATGGFAWLRSFGGSGDAHVVSVATLVDGDVLAGGWFTGELELEGTTVTATGTDSFLVRLAGTDGSVIWTRHLTNGPDAEIAVVGEAADGNLVACGTGTTLIGWFDGAGGFISGVTPPGLSTCEAMARRLGGWYVAGRGGAAHLASFVSVGNDRSAGAAVQLIAAGGPLRVDDLVTLSDGSAAVAITEPVVSGVYRSTLLRVRGDGTVTLNKAAGNAGAFLRSMSMLDDGGGQLLIARRSGATDVSIERLSATTFEVSQSYRLEMPVITGFQLAAEGAGRFLVGESAAARPFPGRSLVLQGHGSFVAKLKLVEATLRAR